MSDNKSLEPLLNDDLSEPFGLGRALRTSNRRTGTAGEPGGSATVGSSSTTVLAANSDRIRATFINDSDETIYLKLGTGAELNKGIRLNANGGAWVETDYTGIVTAICSSGGKNLCVTEV